MTESRVCAALNSEICYNHWHSWIKKTFHCENKSSILSSRHCTYTRICSRATALNSTFQCKPCTRARLSRATHRFTPELSSSNATQHVFVRTCRGADVRRHEQNSVRARTTRTVPERRCVHQAYSQQKAHHHADCATRWHEQVPIACVLAHTLLRTRSAFASVAAH